jgi:hypothetical protein
MKKLLIAVSLILQATGLFSLGGLWKLHSIYEIGVTQGESSSFAYADVELIASFMFDPDKFQRKAFSPIKISMVDIQSNSYKTYTGTAVDDSDIGMIIIGVPDLNNLFVTLYLIKVDNESYQYSYAVGFDLERHVYISEKDTKDYLIFVGMMKRIAQ